MKLHPSSEDSQGEMLKERRGILIAATKNGWIVVPATKQQGKQPLKFDIKCQETGVVEYPSFFRVCQVKTHDKSLVSSLYAKNAQCTPSIKKALRSILDLNSGNKYKLEEITEVLRKRQFQRGSIYEDVVLRRDCQQKQPAKVVVMTSNLMTTECNTVIVFGINDRSLQTVDKKRFEGFTKAGMADNKLMDMIVAHLLQRLN